MAQFDPTKEKLQFEYPGKWVYRLIGKNETSVRNVIKEVLSSEKQYDLTPSNTSKSGKYFSMKLEVTVMNEEERTKLFKTFQQNPDIVMVL